MNIELAFLPITSWDEGPDGLDAWWTHVPRVHRALTNPEGSEKVCAMPPPNAEHGDVIAYWFAAYYLLVEVLGWGNPGLGLKTWYAEGKPETDDALALLKAAWDRNDQLDLLAAWLWSPESSSVNHSRKVLGLDATEGAHGLDPGPEWWRSFEERWAPEVSGLGYDPYHGGGDPLHLQAHITDELEMPKGGFLVRTSAEECRATLLVDRLKGWQSELVRLGGALPELDDRSWHVDVYCQPFGWLGMYRKSRTTGLWFSGHHHVHAMGN